MKKKLSSLFLLWHHGLFLEEKKVKVKQMREKGKVNQVDDNG